MTSRKYNTVRLVYVSELLLYVLLAGLILATTWGPEAAAVIASLLCYLCTRGRGPRIVRFVISGSFGLMIASTIFFSEVFIRPEYIVCFLLFYVLLGAILLGAAIIRATATKALVQGLCAFLLSFFCACTLALSDTDFRLRLGVSRGSLRKVATAPEGPDWSSGCSWIGLFSVQRIRRDPNMVIFVTTSSISGYEGIAFCPGGQRPPASGYVYVERIERDWYKWAERHHY